VPYHKIVTVVVVVVVVVALSSDEYDILPSVESTTNRNPVILIDHKLAVEAWAARLMFCTAVNGLRQWQRTPVFNTEGNSADAYCGSPQIYIFITVLQHSVNTVCCMHAFILLLDRTTSGYSSVYVTEQS